MRRVGNDEERELVLLVVIGRWFGMRKAFMTVIRLCSLSVHVAIPSAGFPTLSLLVYLMREPPRRVSKCNGNN